MKSRTFITSKNNGAEGLIEDLNYNEMINVNGGDNPPPPKPGGDEPIDPFKNCLTITQYVSPQSILVLKVY